MVEKVQGFQRNIEQAERLLRNLDSQSGQQEAKLEQASSDTLKAYRWVLNNQDKFEQEVFGPPVVTCSVNDPKYADAIESLFQKTDFLAFTTQNRRDFRTLQRALIGELQLHDVSIRTCSIPLGNLRSPFSEDEVRRLGFDAWAKDLLSGPEPVLAMLCSENRLNQTPVGLKDISDDMYAELESGSLSSWVSGKYSYQVNRRREYGPSATSTRVRPVKPAQVWTSKPVDASVKQQHQENIELWKEQLAEVSDKMRSEKATLTEVHSAHERNTEETVRF